MLSWFSRRSTAPPSMKTIYNEHIKNLNRTAVKRGVNTFLDDLEKHLGVRLSAATRTLVHNSVDVRTAKEFKTNIDKCCSWLKGNVNDKPYALFVEVMPSSKENRPKSSLFLAHRVVAALGPPVALVITYEDRRLQDGSLFMVEGLQKALARGAECIVHLNDAVYTGQQLGEQLKALVLQLTRVHGFGLTLPIYVATAYGTNVKALIEKKTYSSNRYVVTSYTKRHYPMKMYFAESIPFDPLRTLKNRIMKNAKRSGTVSNRIEKLNVRPALTLLPHKIPNSHSIGVRTLKLELTRYLEDALGNGAGSKWKAPYKKNGIRSNKALAELILLIKMAKKQTL